MEQDILDWLAKWPLYAPAIAALAALIQFILKRKQEERDRQFREFHRLIGELVNGAPGQDSPRIDQQAAIVFELQFYPRYYAFTLRTLNGLVRAWRGNPNNQRVLSELNRTIKFLEKEVWDPEERY